jgi:hypothetical protein
MPVLHALRVAHVLCALPGLKLPALSAPTGTCLHVPPNRTALYRLYCLHNSGTAGCHKMRTCMRALSLSVSTGCLPGTNSVRRKMSTCAHTAAHETTNRHVSDWVQHV